MNNSIDNIDNSNRNLILIAIIGIIISVLLSFVNGVDSFIIFYRIGDWSTTLILALFINWVLTSKNLKSFYLPFLLFIPCLINSFSNSLMGSLIEIKFEYINIYYAFTHLIYCFIYFFVLYKTYKLIKNKKSSLNPSEDIGEPKTNVTLLDKIILSIEERVKSSSKRIFFSLIAMIVIVIIGSSASFGTVALNEANKIRELESERNKMLTATRLLKNIDDENTSKKIDEIKKLIEDKYGKSNDYEELISNIEKESYISWPDIAMRITIAALTLFLVQVFFHIYKYNQRQETNLLSKVEVFRLFTDEKAELSQLRNGLISKMNPNIEFDKSPSSPTEQIINIIGKTRNTE